MENYFFKRVGPARFIASLKNALLRCDEGPEWGPSRCVFYYTFQKVKMNQPTDRPKGHQSGIPTNPSQARKI
ncbi:hypothetical protein PhaeoP97_02839 [Phaeobacter porticola]|uniref:Uncharacterized protein n=1 Tax=Phaeobacter porticola TaxID=1844006 RepID=A0A1L3I812_9RHOB|nr:hypothetical protein PhaeoP97_02839 [Phaeobacter porticola]